MKKVATLLGAGALLFSACGEVTETTGDNVQLVDVAFDKATYAPGDKAKVTGSIEGSKNIESLTITVELNLGDTTVNMKDITGAHEWVEKGAVPSDSDVDLEDMSIAINIPADAKCDGEFDVKFVAVVGDDDNTVTKTLKLDAEGDVSCIDEVKKQLEATQPAALTTKDVELGSFAATAGSSLDADDMTVYTASDAKAKSAEIDLWYSNEAEGANVLYSPKSAAAIKHPPKDWSTQNETKFAVVADLDVSALKSQSDLDAEWAKVESSAKAQVSVKTGDVVLLKTNKGKVVAVEVTSADATGTSKSILKATGSFEAPAAE